MRIDWIVATVTFLMFVIWAFTNYSFISTGEMVSRSDAALQSTEKISDYMGVGFSSIPVVITASSDMNNVTVWAYMNWAGDEKNSTRIVKSHLSNQSQPCDISGDRLYWKANLTSGDNYFFIENIDWETSLNCGQAIPPTDENQSTLWVTESGSIFSDARNSMICGQMNQSYESTRKSIGVTFDFNILIETAGGSSTCGIPVPISGRDVFVFPVSGALWEGGDVNMSVRLW